MTIFDFTSKEIKSALERAKRRGVKIRIIADSRQAKGEYSVIPSLIEEGVNVKTLHGKDGGVMANSFAIFDRALIFTGSYNWTDDVEYFNYENAIVFSDSEIIEGPGVFLLYRPLITLKTPEGSYN